MDSLGVICVDQKAGRIAKPSLWPHFWNRFLPGFGSVLLVNSLAPPVGAALLMFFARDPGGHCGQPPPQRLSEVVGPTHWHLATGVGTQEEKRNTAPKFFPWDMGGMGSELLTACQKWC